MIVLGIEGALGGFSAAVSRDDAIEGSVAHAGNVALEEGLSIVASALRDARVEASQLDRLAVGVGPGGFTGLRITIAYAKSLAQAWQLPLVGVSSFDVLEWGRNDERALTVVTGRTGVISARYRDPVRTERASGPIADVLRVVLPPSDGKSLPVYGAAEDVLAALAEGGFIVDTRTPTVVPAAAAVALAGAALQPAASAHEVCADYGEAPAAKVPRFHAPGKSS